MAHGCKESSLCLVGRLCQFPGGQQILFGGLDRADVVGKGPREVGQFVCAIGHCGQLTFRFRRRDGKSQPRDPADDGALDIERDDERHDRCGDGETGQKLRPLCQKGGLFIVGARDFGLDAFSHGRDRRNQRFRECLVHFKLTVDVLRRGQNTPFGSQ